MPLLGLGMELVLSIGAKPVLGTWLAPICYNGCYGCCYCWPWEWPIALGSIGDRYRVLMKFGWPPIFD